MSSRLLKIRSLNKCMLYPGRIILAESVRFLGGGGLFRGEKPSAPPMISYAHLPGVRQPKAMRQQHFGGFDKGTIPVFGTSRSIILHSLHSTK